MIFHKSETVELKEIVVDGVKKEIAAFANSTGGTLYIGARKTSWKKKSWKLSKGKVPSCGRRRRK